MAGVGMGWELGAPYRSPVWVAGTQVREPSLLSSKAYTGRKLEFLPEPGIGPGTPVGDGGCCCFSTPPLPQSIFIYLT